MADKSNIEWTEATWNPLRGCTRVSEGCRFCYAETVAARFSGPGQPYEGLARFVTMPDGSKDARWTGKVHIAWDHLSDPIRWARPRMIFANSMSDLFHESVPAEEIATIYAVAVAAVHLRGHVIQILTKRAARAREILTSEAFWEQVNIEASMHVMEGVDSLARRSNDARATLEEYGPGKPPPGIWMGTSTEHQEAFNERWPELRATPAAVRFLSVEPQIGRIDMCEQFGIWWNQTTGEWVRQDGVIRPDLVIQGGESGSHAREFRYSWAESLLRQCRAASIAYFLKQMGSNPIDDLGYREIAHAAGLKDKKGGEMAEWPERLRVREMPGVPSP